MVRLTDIVFPQNNETEFIQIAETLGLKELVFVYPFSQLTEFKLRSNTKYNTKIKISFGIYAKPNDILKAKHVCNFVISDNCSDNRKVIECFRPSLVFDYENHSHHDFIHHRNSGLNHVLCKLMQTNGIEYAICFSSILNLDSEKRVKILGRVKQNIRLCKKYKIKLDIYTFATKPFEMRNKKDLIMFLKL